MPQRTGSATLPLLGIFVAGGKGKVSRRTPLELIGHSERLQALRRLADSQ